VLPWLLVAQAVVGGADTIVNHEVVARLPRRPEARPEIALHAVREAIYATLFLGLGLFRWEGALAWAIVALLVAEVLVTSIDEWIENRTRLLPQNERLMHVFLTLNLGLVIAVALPVLLDWSVRDTALVRVHYGLPGWLLAFFGLAAAAWSVRDALAWTRMGRLEAE